MLSRFVSAHAASLSVKNTFIEVTESEDAVSEGLRRVSSCPSLHSPGDGSNEAACSQDSKPQLLTLFSRRSLIQLLDNNGFRGKYDFIYMPMDFKRGLCIGYAFVNMTTPDHMQSFIKVFDGFNFRATQYKSSKVCAVSPSKTQGLSANIERYQNSPLMSDEVPDGYKPVLFGTRGRIPFPKPTKVVPHIQHRS